MLRSLIIALVLLFACNVSAAEDGHRYSNPTLGFEAIKPANWHFMTLAQNQENLKRAQFGTSEFKTLVLTQSSAPLVVMTRHEEPYEGLNASVKVGIKPLGGLPSRDGKALLDLILPTVRKQFADARIVQPPQDTMVAGLPAAHAVIDYTMRNTDGGEFPTTSEMWLVPTGDFFYMIGAGYSQGDAATRAEIGGILATMKIMSLAKSP